MGIGSKVKLKLLATASIAVTLILAAGVGQGHASVITAPSAGMSYLAFAPLNSFGGGPVTVAPGVTWSSTNLANQGGSVYGWNQGYGFGANGFSNSTLTGLNDSSDYYGVVDTMTFSFSSPVSGVGAILNWVPSSGNPVTIQAFNSMGQQVDSLTLSPGASNPGVNSVTPNSFHGFQDATNDISSFTLTDGYVAAIGGLGVNGFSGPGAGVPVPAPAPGAGLLSLAFLILASALTKGRGRASFLS